MDLRRRTVVVLAVLAVLLSACGAPSAQPGAAAPEATAQPGAAAPAATAQAPAASDQKPIKIGLSTPLTGPSSSVGEGFDMGVTMAIEDLGGQIAGRKIELYKADNKCAPADAVTAVRRLIDEDQVDAIIGSSCSGATLAALPIIQEGQIVQLSVTSSNPTIYDQLGVGGNDWGFRLNLDDLIIAKTLAGYIAQEQTKSIFLIGQNNDFGRGGVKAYEEELPKVGVTVAGSEFYDDGTSDFRPILTKIKQSGADGIMTFMVEHDSAPFFRQMKETGLQVKVYTRGGVTSPLFLEMTKDDPTLAEGAIGASYWTSGMDPETEKRFQERWNSPPTVHRMMAYYGMKLVLADAIERAIAKNGDVTRDGIREALTTTDLKGTPIGDITFDDHHQAYPFLTLDTIKDGKISLLKTLPAVKR
jgi:branched-chain amino acid transport system substrate-binding protein